jgi:hypothetical protein
MLTSQADSKLSITPAPASVVVPAVNPTVAISEDLNYRISDECKVRLHFDGKVTKEAIQKFIQYLQLAKDDYPSSGKQEAEP